MPMTPEIVKTNIDQAPSQQVAGYVMANTLAMVRVDIYFNTWE